MLWRGSEDAGEILGPGVAGLGRPAFEKRSDGGFGAGMAWPNVQNIAAYDSCIWPLQ